MDTFEVSTNVDKLIDKCNQLVRLTEEINDLEITATCKKRGEITEISLINTNELSKMLTKFRKLIKQIDNFKIKAKTRKKKATT